ncbi:uncharacterized protein LOC101862205 [Aplysia californica]|uniref:Trimethylguanosine synthase n=1 Tax=Aplysia californica TaxID=6500 RepID=A0ABM0JZZ8_APLCA|nr:uncharacterized protein LOC101862205 [Aplysia californica]
MWYKRQILAEIRAYTCLSEEEDAKVEPVQAYITQSFIREKKYRRCLGYLSDNDKGDQTELDCGNKEQSTAADGTTLQSQGDKLSATLSSVDLNGCKKNFCDKNIGAEAFVHSDENVCIKGEPNSEIQKESESLYEEGFDSSSLLMESMGLPTNFGRQKKKSRKKRKLTEKQIRAKFSELWDEHGELLVYKSFVSIYPAYAGYYDQIAGSIPPCEEVEISCSDNVNEPNNAGDLKDGDSGLEVFGGANSHSVISEKEGQVVGDIVEEKETGNVTDGGDSSVAHIVSSGEEIVSCSDDKGFVRKDENLHKDVSAHESEMTDAESCRLTDEPGDQSQSRAPGGRCSYSEHSYSEHSYNEHSYSEHSYNAAEGVRQSGADQEHCSQEDYGAGEENESYQYSPEELIGMLQGTHEDLKNQIYWHAKETISEWYRENPHVDFDISSLDEDVMAIAYPYMDQQQQWEGEGEEGEEDWQGEEEDDEYQGHSGNLYAEEKDEDLLDENGHQRNCTFTETLELLGLAVENDPDIRNTRKRKLVHGTVIYKRKNILKEGKRLRLDNGQVTKEPTHTFFDDEGNAISVKNNNSEKEEEPKKPQHIIFPDSDQEEDEGPLSMPIRHFSSSPGSKFSTQHTDSTNNRSKRSWRREEFVFDEFGIMHVKGENGSRPTTGHRFRGDLGFIPSAMDAFFNRPKPRSRSFDEITRTRKPGLSQDLLGLSSFVSRNVYKAGVRKAWRSADDIVTYETSVVLKGDEEKAHRSKQEFRRPPGLSPEEYRIRENKYFSRRFELFSLYDKGIQLDDESWYSVTPEAIAAYTALRCKGKTVIDGFCGAGGNSIQFAKHGCRVISIDIDPKKIDMAKNNARIYGVLDQIEFHCGDFFEEALQFKDEAEIVFLSPPWGGPNYKASKVFPMEDMQATRLLSISRAITENIIFFLPRNCSVEEIFSHAGSNKKVEVEKNFMGRCLKALTAYYGDLVMPQNWGEPQASKGTSRCR